jgi:hypothetical protein
MKKSALNLILGLSCLGWLGAAGWSSLPRDYLFTEVAQQKEVDVNVNDLGKSAVLQPRSYNNPAVTLAFLAMAGLSGVALAKSLEGEQPAKAEDGSVVPRTQQQVATPIVIRNTNVQRTSAPRPQAVATPKPPQFEEEVYEDDEPITVAEYSKGVFTGDIIGEVADTDLHVLIATKSGAGKSTLLKALIQRIKKINSASKFGIVDPKTTDWLGLQSEDGVVTYLDQDTQDEQLDAASEQIGHAFRIMKNRIRAVQKILREGGKRPVFAPQYLILDEWWVLQDMIASSKREAEFFGMLNQIVAMGREMCVRLILVAQTHLCTQIGFSDPVRGCFSVLALGRMGEKNDVGYRPIEAALADAKLFPNKQQRVSLAGMLGDAIAMAKKQGDRPVLLTTMGIPKIALMPDLKHLNGFRFDSEESEDAEEPMDDPIAELDRILAIGKGNLLQLPLVS